MWTVDIPGPGSTALLESYDFQHIQSDLLSLPMLEASANVLQSLCLWFKHPKETWNPHGCGGCPLHSPTDCLPTATFSRNPQRPLRRPGATRCCAEIGPPGESVSRGGGPWNPWSYGCHPGGWIQSINGILCVTRTTLGCDLVLFTGQGWDTSWNRRILWDMGISPRRSQKNGWTLDLSYELYPAFNSKGQIESILGPNGTNLFRRQTVFAKRIQIHHQIIPITIPLIPKWWLIATSFTGNASNSSTSSNQSKWSNWCQHGIFP